MNLLFSDWVALVVLLKRVVWVCCFSMFVRVCVVSDAVPCEMSCGVWGLDSPRSTKCEVILSQVLWIGMDVLSCILCSLP